MAAVKRLMKELADLQRAPVAGASARPVGENMLRWKAIVIGAAAPYDFPVRVELVYSAEYPMAAPKAYFETPVFYQGGLMLEREGRWEVCLNIFGNFAHVHTEWASQSEGWTPAYTIETILVSLQALLMSDFVSQRDKDVRASRAAALAFKCKETGHDGSSAALYWPPLASEGATAGAAAAACAGAAAAAASGDETARPSAGAEQAMCYVTKLTEAEGSGPLGFGVNVDNARLLSFSSPCEHLSLEAFKSGVRASSTNKPIEFWVPVITPTSKWPALRQSWPAALETIARRHGGLTAGAAGSSAAAGLVAATVKLCCSVMNTLVVEIMNAKHQLTANDKFIDGYFAFYRVLMEVRRENKAAAVALADGAIEAFMGSAAGRSKAAVPNLGEWLLLLLVSERHTWASVAEAFVGECDARNVFWYVQGTAASPGACRDLADRARAPRADRIFAATPVSRSLVCYQVRFLHLAASTDFKAVDAAGGRVSDAVKAEIKSMHAAITAMRGWDEHFAWLGMGARAAAQRERELVAALDASAAAGYHGGSSAAAPAGGRGGRGGGYGAVGGGRGGRGGRGGW